MRRHTKTAAIATLAAATLAAALASCGTAPGAPSPAAAPGNELDNVLLGLRTTPPAAPASDLPEVLVDRDDIAVDRSCRLRFTGPVADADGDGVVHVTAPNVTVDLGGGTLAGCAEGTAPDAMAGTGIRITAPGVFLTNGAVRGFKVAVHATGCDGATFTRLNLAGNWGARLLSAPRAEDGRDWLWPHANDKAEWRTNYGAALCIERAKDVLVQGVRASGGQNGIVLDRVERSAVLECDCSFLSGWGLAMWRSSRNLVARNAFDFCVRGYSHGIYNRGQDSAGILCFEQCAGNVFALNSATHCGDGFFGFAGKEAIGEVPPPAPFADAAAREEWYRTHVGSNLLLRNDFSFAAAHGMEMTFSRGDSYVENTVVGAGICGLWGGYSQRGIAVGNVFSRCGEAPAGSERGGINIEHGSSWLIQGNTFEKSPVGVRLWWDDDAALLALPGVKANGSASGECGIVGNRFEGIATGIELAASKGVTLRGNSFTACGKRLEADAESTVTESGDAAAVGAPRGAPPARAARSAEWDAAVARIPGRAEPVGARAKLGGRDAIQLGTHGPFDWGTPRIELVHATPSRHWWRVLGTGPLEGTAAFGKGFLTAEIDPATKCVVVRTEDSWGLHAYQLTISAKPREIVGTPLKFRGAGVVSNPEWFVRAFPIGSVVPQDPAAFAALAAKGVEGGPLESLDFRFGSGGPSDLRNVWKLNPLGDSIRKAGLPADRFGIQAKGKLNLDPGCWRIRTNADDAIRVRVDGTTVLERWGARGAAEDTWQVEVAAPRTVELEVDYMEVDGDAALTVLFEPCQPVQVAK